jgi:hypothetical protein
METAIKTISEGAKITGAVLGKIKGNCSGPLAKQRLVRLTSGHA